jgi:ubiquinone/menaquinone biosynthesis C-methylase UbiE
MLLRKFLEPLIPAVGRNNEGFREKWLEEMLLKVPNSSRILDAGAGTQKYRKYCKHLQYVSQDFGQYDGKGDNAALQTGYFDYGKLDIVSDITSIPEPDSSFDAILCSEVLEHLPNPIQAIKEFSRLLKKNGQLIITAPFCSLTHFAPYHFSTGFNRYWYEKHLLEYGFEIEEIGRNGNFFEYLAQEIYRIPFTSKCYSKMKPHLFELLSMVIVQNMLLRFSKNDSGSSELLCFGYHVRARKD